MNAIRSIHLCHRALSICICFGLCLFLGGCNDRSASNTGRNNHTEHGDHDGHNHHAHDHNEHKGHAEQDHNEHKGHEEADHRDVQSDAKDIHKGHDHDSTLRIGHLEQQELGIEIATAGPNDLILNISLPGEIVLNPDNVAHVVPRVSGVTRSVHKRVGDSVEHGDLLAVLDSREIAQTKAHFLAALSKERIALANFNREDKLWKEKISSERTFLDAQQTLEEVQIARTLAERELHALGLSEDDVTSLPAQSEVQHTHYQLTAPISGTIIERHLVRGEVVKEDTDEPVFVIADLTSVWLTLTVHTTHLDQVRPGQTVLITLPNRSKPLTATIDYITLLIDHSTRTATARVVLPNPNGTLRPGLFVTATIVSDTIAAPILVPTTAIHTIDGQPTVFIQRNKGFMPVTVNLGVSNDTRTEILAGLTAGDSYVVRGGFVLKSETMKSELEHAGHVH